MKTNSITVSLLDHTQTLHRSLAEADPCSSFSTKATNGRLATLLVTMVTSMLLAVPPLRAAPPSKVTTLPDIPGAADLVVADINSQGTVIGNYNDENFNPQGFIYAGGAYTRIDILPNKINDLGQIVGTTFDSSTSEIHNFIYDKGVYRSFTLPNAKFTVVTGINDQGQIVGIQDNHGFLFDKGRSISLPGVAGAQDIYPQSINNQGQIVGFSYNNRNIASGFSYYNGIYTQLNFPGAQFTSPTDTNDKGQVVGTSSDYYFNTQSFIYEKGVYTGIDVPGAQLTIVYGINNRGQIVGTYYDGDFLPHGFIMNR
jgi:probable HAF family extracellular repeat protein